jgi:transcription elongation factor Elf1
MTSDRNVLALQCPHCGHEYLDDYECLDSAKVGGIRCEASGCRQQFSFLIRECPDCGEESVFTWKAMPAPDTFALLSCNHCGAPLDEPASQGQSPDPAQRI